MFRHVAFQLRIFVCVGNIDVFNAVVDSHREDYFAQDVLKNCHEQIQQKVGGDFS